MSSDKPRVGFIGLGLMGHGMAKNLVSKGFPLTVRVHRNRKPAEDILAAGAREAKTNAELARASDIVILCVTGSPQIEEIVYGENGILGAAREGLIVVDTSTAEPASTRPRERSTSMLRWRGHRRKPRKDASTLWSVPTRRPSHGSSPFSRPTART